MFSGYTLPSLAHLTSAIVHTRAAYLTPKVMRVTGAQAAGQSPLVGRHGAHGAALVHLITSSARERIDGGIVKRSFLAVLRFITNSSLVACSIGRSAGLAPFK